MASNIDGDVFVRGTLRARTMSLPNDTVDDDAVDPSAGIAASKLEHQHQPLFARPSDETAAAMTEPLHITQGTTGSVVAFKAGVVTACVGDSTVTVDLLKNGTSILSSAITLDSSDAARDVVAGTVDTQTLAADDVLEVDVSVSAGTGTLGEGVFAFAVIREDAE